MIAEVIVDISHSSVDRIFDYEAIPNAAPGTRVSVPFGSRIIEGYVVSRKDRSDLDPSRIKAIAAVLDDYPVITEEMLLLMKKLVDKYCWRIVDVLRLFLPAQMRGGKVKPLKISYAALTDAVPFSEIIDALSHRASAQAEVAEFLHAEGSVRVSELAKRFSPSAVPALVKKGFVVTTKERVMRKPYRNATAEGGEEHRLTPDQQVAYDAVAKAERGTFLLHGVTGSGKTEVYIRLILDCLARGKTAIMLVPEISLTPQVLRLFRARFGDRVAILHSGLSSGERLDEWTRLREGSASIAIGARSAIFAPLERLGIIVIDEEHDASYFSEMTPQYDTHEIAAIRAEYNGCPLLLGSATPGIDSYRSAAGGRYTLLEMPNRINRRALPEIRVVDMCEEIRRGNPSFLSVALRQKLTECLDARHQAILFLNRRGYASYQQCRACGYVVKCEDCDMPMVYHRDDDKLKCHYCAKRSEALTVCPNCGSSAIKQGAMGTERVAAELARLYPRARILRMDRDTTETKDAHEQILSAFRNGEADILVGTQMVAKGHDFGACTLVGILEADLSLYTADFRAAERTFQLITQVAGRAGRAELDGSVILQTYSPRHYIFRYAISGDYKGFYEREINVRETTKFPPFSVIVRVMVVGEDESRAIETLHKINDDVLRLRTQFPETFAFAKSMRAPIKKIQSKYRVQLIVRLIGDRREDIVTEICRIAERRREDKSIITVEVNPQNLK